MDLENNTGLWKAMLECQREVEHATKDSKNPHLKNRYASLNSVLDTIKPVANKHGLVITQLVMAVPQDRFPGMACVQTKVVHADTGAFLEDNQTIPMPKNDPQGLGSAITYARRYGLISMFGIGSEDDDGNSASGVGGGVAARVDANPVARPVAAVVDKPATSEQVKAVEQKLSAALGFKR